MIDVILRGITKFNLWLRYRIELKGLDTIENDPSRSILFLPNHPALIDPVVVMSVLLKQFRPGGLGDENQIDRFLIRRLARRYGIIPVPDLAATGPGARQGVSKAIEQVIEQLQSGRSMLLYPSGHAYHTRYEDLRGNSAVRTILDAIPDQRIVLLRTTGLWGSRFSRAWGVEPDVGRTMKKALGWLTVNGLFFMPRRKVTLEFVEPDDLPRDGSRNEINEYLETFYNADAPPATKVPYYWWQGSKPQAMSEPESHRVEGDSSAVAGATREIVMDKLRDLSGVKQIDDSAHLAAELGLDSLARADLLVWLQREFGVSGGNVESLVTAGDVLLVASGQGTAGMSKSISPPPSSWLPEKEDRGRRLEIPAGQDLCEAFLNQARRGMGRCVLADQRSGVKTYRDLLTGIFALKPIIERFEGDSVGIMLPASVGATTVYLATLFAGKTPVMVNWTVGPRNIRHGLELTGVKTILTAGALLENLDSQGVDVSDLKNAFYPLERLKEDLSGAAKIKAAIKARLGWKLLYRCKPTKTAAVLFTSGSEARPKAVPLSHANVLANMRDVLAAVEIFESDRLMGFLPPFHSFGLTVTACLAVTGALPTVYHPDPTESDVLFRLIEAYRASLVVGTPTFLAGIARAAGDRTLDSLRLAVTGAEACGQATYRAIARACPNATVIEGYGITECSPIVAVNRPDDPQRGKIGPLLPSLEAALVDPETGEPVEPGEKGMLLVRGPSVFDGYLGPDAPDPFVEHEGKRWYRTGDLVTMDDRGVLTFKGRFKRFVKIGGEMVSLPAIESVLAEHLSEPEDEEPQFGVVPAGPEGQIELVLFSVRQVEREQVNRWIRGAGLSGLHNIRRVEPIEEMPLLGTGKVDYRSLQRRLDGQDS